MMFIYHSHLPDGLKSVSDYFDSIFLKMALQCHVPKVKLPHPGLAERYKRQAAFN